LFKSRFSLSKKCSTDILKLIYFIIPQPNKISKNVDKLYINHDLIKPLKQIVCSGYWKLKFIVDNVCNDQVCVCIIVGNRIDFNKWYKSVTTLLPDLLNQRVIVKNFKPKLFTAIFAVPAIAEALNMINHAGCNACINCEV
jgi:hypothetical protein